MCVHTDMCSSTSPCSRGFIGIMMARDQTSPPKHLKLFVKVTQTLGSLFVGTCATWGHQAGWLSWIWSDGQAEMWCFSSFGYWELFLFVYSGSTKPGSLNWKTKLSCFPALLECLSHWSHFYLLWLFVSQRTCVDVTCVEPVIVS